MTEENKGTPLLSEDQVWDVVSFAQALTGSVSGLSSVSGLFTPHLLNWNLQNLNNNPRIPTYETLCQALNEAVKKSENLQAYSEWMEFMDMIFKRTMMYYENMLSFDLIITCNNASGGDYNSSKYKRDRAIVDDFLDRFDYQTEFRKMVKQMLRTETAFTWLRHNDNPKDMKYTLQTMPQKYCLLTGYFEQGLLYDFDMNFFLQPGRDILEYDPAFLDIMNRTFCDGGIEDYFPTNSFKDRTGLFAYWTQLSPCYTLHEDDAPHGAWAFKFDMGNFAAVPFLSAMMKDTILNLPIQKLQYDKDIAGAYGMLMGEIEMLNSQEPNATAFSPKNLGMLMNIVKKAIGKYIAVGAMPARNVDFYQYEDKNTEMYFDQLQSSASLGAAGNRVIYSSDKMSQEEIRNAIITDYNVMKRLYSQFENFLNFYVNKLTKKFKFNFTFTGSTYPFERKARQDGIMELADKGIVLNDTAFASAYGYKPNDFRRMLEETHAENSWTKDLTMLISLYTQSNKENVGRPVEDDVTTQAREYDNSNE